MPFWSAVVSNRLKVHVDCDSLAVKFQALTNYASLCDMRCILNAQIHMSVTYPSVSFTLVKTMCLVGNTFTKVSDFALYECLKHQSWTETPPAPCKLKQAFSQCVVLSKPICLLSRLLPHCLLVQKMRNKLCQFCLYTIKLI